MGGGEDRGQRERELGGSLALRLVERRSVKREKIRGEEEEAGLVVVEEAVTEVVVPLKAVAEDVAVIVAAVEEEAVVVEGEE